MVVIPKNYPEYTARRVHTAEWVDGEKLSQSVESDVGALVNLGVITYLTQLLDTGFFHAGNVGAETDQLPCSRLWATIFDKTALEYRSMALQIDPC